MKRVFSLIVLGLFALSLTSCIRDDDDYEGNGEIFVDKEWDIYESGHQVTAPVEISFWSANSAVDLHGSVMADMVEEFNAMQKAKYPNSYIKVNASFQGGYTNQNSKLQAALIGGTNPEIAMVGVSSMALYVDNAIDMRQIFTYDEIRNIYEGFLQFAMYKNKFVAYPYFASTNVYIVNRTLVNKSGLNIPTVDEILADPENSSWTWEAFKTYVETARDVDNGIYGAAIANIPLYEAYYTQGVPIYNEKCTEALIDNQYGLKMLTYWQDIVGRDLVKNPVIDPNHGTKIQGEFAAGTVGMYKATSSVTKSLFQVVVENQLAQGKEPLFEMDVLPHPKETNFYSNQSGGGLLVFNNKNDQKTKAAIEFLRWLQADEQSVNFSINTGYLTTTKTSTETTAWKDYSKINPLLDRVVKLMTFTPPEGVKIPVGRAKALADDDFVKYSRGIFYDNCTRDPQAVLKECQERIAYILDTNS